MARVDDNAAIASWHSFVRAGSAGMDPNEPPGERIRRVKELERDPERWFAYYFEKFYKCTPARFHIRASHRILTHPEWWEVRVWSRDLAKSTRAMMELCYLALTGKKKTIILVSNSQDNAERLLSPYIEFFEHNERMIFDYGAQVSPGSWTTSEFTTQCGACFRALGAGQSPRGSRNEELRPDAVVIDDIDTDQDCLNPDIITKRWRWIERALYATRDTSEPFLMLFCGNLIAEDCCIARAMEKANKVDVVNIRDEDGKSTWPSKNTEEKIDLILSRISLAAQQSEYYNNPTTEGSVFGALTWGECPPISRFRFLVAYADPATSNKDKKTSCTKALVLCGFYAGKYYVINCYLDHATTDTFIQWFYDLRAYCKKSDKVLYYIENNSLQDAFYEQVFLPKFGERGATDGHAMGVIPDRRKKGDKYTRIEAMLEPLVRTSSIVFNAAERGNLNMRRLEDQFRLVTPRLSAPCDGVDAVEGALYIIRDRLSSLSIGEMYTARKISSKKF